MTIPAHRSYQNLFAVKPIILHFPIHRRPVPEAAVIGVENICGIALFLQNLRKGIVFTIGIPRKHGTRGQRQQGTVCDKVRIGRSSLPGLMIKIAEIHALFHQSVEVRRDFLTLDGLANDKIHEGFRLNRNNITVFILAKPSVRTGWLHTFGIKPGLDLIDLLLSQLGLANQVIPPYR